MNAKVQHLSTDDRRARGKEAGNRTPPSSHAGWEPAVGRPDPVALLEEQNTTREPDLVPVRHGRMMVSPFTFYRGAAKIMAADLKGTPTAGLSAQLCGDAHLSNFGAFASPERRLMFDLNDFDETLPGPFEYDVKRMAASFMVAARNNGFAKADARAVTTASAAAYREAMASFAQMRTLEIWYAHLSEEDILAALQTQAKGKKSAKELNARRRTSTRPERGTACRHCPSSPRWSTDRYRIVSQPPIVVPLRDLAATYGMEPADVDTMLHEQFRAYRTTLQNDRRHLLERFQFVDVARKVVGVGSVGTGAWIVLLEGRDGQDPLFLQVKEASASVLEDHLPKSRFRQPGERVVQGQRMMQAASDIFLGWTRGADVSRHFYWRQLRDMKGSALVEAMSPSALGIYASICGWTLARAHARSGDPIAISEYLGDSDAFDRAVADFSKRYADQNDRDYQEFVDAIRSGRLQALQGV